MSKWMSRWQCEERGDAKSSAGRSIIPMTPSAIPTPECLAAFLREAETPGHGASAAHVELAETMEERHLHYAGVLQTRKRAVSQIGVQIEPASDAADDVRDADLVREFFRSRGTRRRALRHPRLCS